MAHDFRNKTFQKVLRGYAPEEVDDYIAYLNEEYRKLERRTADSERKLALALKKLEESSKSGGSDTSVGPAAREAASKLMRE
ncbi:MAG: DivIVA domain-containing protein, partial [Clostridia bacterium]|nr:DivIVA domain-containing protein [Clostridia bacterium]